MSKVVHITELPLEDLVLMLREKIIYQKEEYIDIIFGNAWEVQIHKTYGTAIGIDRTNLKRAIADAIGKLKKEL